jgi:hypothetical protein
MPKTDIDYSNTIIYKITCKDTNIKDVYVGHTTNFVQRKHAHKQGCNNAKSTNYKCKLYEVMRNNGGWTNWNMEIINFFNCIDHYEARKKEQEFFVSLNATLNSIEPFPKPKVKNIVTKREINISNTITPNSVNKFYCQTCDFKCNKNSDFKRHLSSVKHNKTIKESSLYICECGKNYTHRASLYNHKKNCKGIQNNIELSNDKSDIVELLINENKEFKNVIIDLVKSNQELQKQLLEVCNVIKNKVSE